MEMGAECVLFQTGRYGDDHCSAPAAEQIAILFERLRIIWEKSFNYFQKYQLLLWNLSNISFS